jgi:hypothetical protein
LLLPLKRWHPSSLLRVIEDLLNLFHLMNFTYETSPPTFLRPISVDAESDQHAKPKNTTEKTTYLMKPKSKSIEPLIISDISATPQFGQVSENF